MENRIDFLGYPVDNLTSENLIQRICTAINLNEKLQIIPINANKVYQVKEDEILAKIIKEAEIVIPEYAIVWGAKLLGVPLVEHIGGIMLMRNLLESACECNFKFYFLGAEEDVLQLMIRNVKNHYPGIEISGWHNGYFSDQKEIIEKINSTDANILLAALGSPKQEYFLYNNKLNLNPQVLMGVGGSFDVFAGIRKETPTYLRHGFEWIYRLIQDPRNLWKRYITTNPYFVFQIFKHKLMKK